jgi:hypothetical protein
MSDSVTENQPVTSPHDLDGFLDEVAAGLVVEYERIRRTARSDPGTAGDQSEAAWAKLFEGWLPASVHVVTKGRIAAPDGRLSQQMDVVVLRDTYPPELAKKKIYLAGGVLAAFECKLTLRKADLTDAAARGRTLRELVGPRRGGTIRDELLPPILYGVLAHSSEGLTSTSVIETLNEGLAKVSHPRETLDLVTVADLGTWSYQWFVYPRRLIPAAVNWDTVSRQMGWPPAGVVSVSYMIHQDPGDRAGPRQNPLYALLGILYRRFEADIGGIKPFADYWTAAAVRGGGAFGTGVRVWGLDIFSQPVQARILRGPISMTADATDPWAALLF